MRNKIHYATVEYGNESNPSDEWSETACGLELEKKYLTNNIHFVDCKNCLLIISNHIGQQQTKQ